MDINSAAKSLLPFIRKGQFGRAFSFAFNQIDHHINIKVLKKREVIRKVNNYPMILNFDEEGLSRDLLIFRKREIAETEIIKEIVKPGMCILEVGANVGYYTILMGKLIGKTGKIYSYEPYPRSLDILIRNLKLNNLTDTVEVYGLAVSDVNTVTKLYLGSATNVHTLMNSKTVDSDSDYIDVETKDIREILVNLDRNIDLLRMDIEGYERRVFNRLNSDIKEFLPARIFFEIHPLGDIDPDPTFNGPLTNMLELGYYPEALISSSNVNAKRKFDELGCQPSKAVSVNESVYYLYNDIKASDLLKVAARRPKIARAILLKREQS